MTATVHSFYRSNIAPEMVAAQARVFAHLEIPLRQWRDDRLTHCDWIDGILRDESAGDLAVIADIDAFPLKRNGYDRLVAQAEAGALAGLAQVANHKDPNRVYAGPMFLALSRQVYRDLGAPTTCRTQDADVAQALTDAAEQRGVPVALVHPRFAIQPRWPLAQHGVFGVGTFYGENEFFHLFESRRTESLQLFQAVAEGTIGQHHDFASYLDIMGQSAPKKRKRFGFF